MTRAPHEIAVPGPAADLAAALAAGLPTLETARLRLRPSRLEDFDAWAEILAAPEAIHMGGPFDRNDAFTEFAATFGLWLLRGHGLMTAEMRDGEVAGFVLIGFEPGDREPELGWMLRPAFRGRGLAEEAARGLRHHALGTLGLASLVSYIDPDNVASRRLAQRLGARLDGAVDGSEVWRHAPPFAPPSSPLSAPLPETTA
ncbi:MAG TPA: GNAT family N-acetyltransferase [Paracoccaceae bacterium]|nr:GNAT family N-acetyltransferase [Paracoccaceae bacterium]